MWSIGRKLKNVYTTPYNKGMSKKIIDISFGEEIGNAVTHGVMALLLLGLLPVLSVYSYLKMGLLSSIGISIFIISLFLMFLASTLYHVMAHDSKHKEIMRILDHSAIFIAIAGSYTPVALSIIKGWQGILVLVIQWSLVVGGIVYKSLTLKGNKKISLIIYLSMGWIAVLFLPQLIQNSNFNFVLWIVVGGVMYSIGAWFYAQKHRPYFHFIWHLFINLASISHLIAMVFYLN
jgi:hemolysin III